MAVLSSYWHVVILAETIKITKSTTDAHPNKTYVIYKIKIHMSDLDTKNLNQDMFLFKLSFTLQDTECPTVDNVTLSNTQNVGGK